MYSFTNALEYAWKTIAKIATDVIEKMEMLVSFKKVLQLQHKTFVTNKEMIGNDIKILSIFRMTISNKRR